MALNNTNAKEDHAVRVCGEIGGEVEVILDALRRIDEELTKTISIRDAEILELKSENARLEQFNREWVSERERLASS